MRPLNSKERSTLVWQFIFIFLTLCVIPVGIIFFSYYKVPVALSDTEREKLAEYSDFDRNQKIHIKQLNEIDSNISLLATNNGNPASLEAIIADKLVEITKNDTSTFMKNIKTGYSHHFDHVVTALKSRENYEKEIKSKQDEIDKCKSLSQMNNNSGATRP